MKTGKPVLNAKRDPLFRCPFPNCGSVFAKEPGQPNACIRHRRLVADVLFILDNTHGPATGKPPEDQGPKLFIPKPGMGDKAIEEARRAAGEGP